MILIIAIIINIIMIVTVNVVITGIIMMKTCFFFIIALFINVIINKVTCFVLFCFYIFVKSISLSLTDLDTCFFHVWKTCTLPPHLTLFLSILKLYLDKEEPLSP